MVCTSSTWEPQNSPWKISKLAHCSGEIIHFHCFAALLGEVAVLAGERVARLGTSPGVLHVRQPRFPVLGQPDAPLRHVQVVLK